MQAPLFSLRHRASSAQSGAGHALGIGAGIVSRVLRCTFLPFYCILLCALVQFLAETPALATDEPYGAHQVSWRSGDAEISGTLLTPEGEGPHPAVVFVHGSGPATRASLMTQPGIRGEGLAERFAERGIAVLVYDKRGSGESTGNADYTYEQLAQDALGGVRLLRGRDEVDPDEVGLWGISEGGWIVPMAASRSEGVAFVVVVSASGFSPARQELWRIRNNLDHSGAPEDLLDTTTKAWKVVYSSSNLPLPESARRALSNLRLDPIPLWRNVDQPMLAVYGNEDKSVPPAESAAILEKALGEGGNRDHTLISFPNADHSLVVSKDGYSYPPGKLRYAPGYVDSMTDWILEDTGTRAPGTSSQTDPNSRTKLPPSETPVLDPSQVSWYGTALVQIGLMAAFVLVFAAAVFVRVVRALLRRPGEPSGMPTAARRARLLATLVSVLDLVVLVGFVAFAAEVVRVEGLGPPPAWAFLKALGLLAAVLTLALLVATAAAARRGVGASPAIRVSHLLLALSAVLFIPFMVYWNLMYLHP
jgi:dienelactone hydrolase